VTKRRNLVAVESEDNLEMEIEQGEGGGARRAEMRRSYKKKERSPEIGNPSS
jgi:hypothetical protein